jgi:hypothetical protein
MTDDVVSHPYRELMAEAQREREIVDTPEAQALQCAIAKAVSDYEGYLIEHDLLWDDVNPLIETPRFKSTALIITSRFDGACDIKLKDGAIDRVFADGVNPDPDGRGPRDIPRHRRPLSD